MPGDLLHLDAGDVVTADMRLVEARSLRINEAALTGESVPVRRSRLRFRVTAAVLADQRNMAFSGTAVTYGRGLGLVVATGMPTALGRVADSSGTWHRPAPLSDGFDARPATGGCGFLVASSSSSAVSPVASRSMSCSSPR